MSSSSDLTYSPPYRVRVITWNILHDNNAAGNHALQADRLDAISALLNKYTLSTPTIIYICEAVSADHFDKLASKLPGLKSLGCVAYPNDYMGFISNVKDATFLEIGLPEMRIRWPKTKAIALHSKHLSIVGIHQPDPVGIRGTKARLSIIKLALKHAERAGLIVGDFNALSFQPSRILLWMKGFRRAKTKWPYTKSKFPNPTFRGKNLPKLTPSMSIDEQYRKGLVLENSISVHSDLSDHPLLICDYVA